MKGLDYHKHLVNMLGCISDVENPVIVLELCGYGDLRRFLRQHKELFESNFTHTVVGVGVFECTEGRLL